MKITIYTNPQCPYSKKVLTFFRRRKLPFEEKTLFKEEVNRLEIIDLTGQLYTPVIQIDDQIFTGFDEDKLKIILQQKKTKKPKSFPRLPQPSSLQTTSHKDQ